MSRDVKVLKAGDDVSYVPSVDPNYVAWGAFELVLDIIKSGVFYPLWITGQSGNGKTVMVQQACAQAQRDFIRVNFTTETDETDLIGGLRIVGGDTIFEEGAVLTAMRRGAVLLLDEVDAAHTNKIMCLQGVVDGHGILVKTTGEFVKPAKGFQVFATGNTRGRGSEDGRFIGTQMMNAAFLDRFPAMITQKFPPKHVEKDIIVRHAGSVMKMVDRETLYIIDCLINWADGIRDRFMKEEVEEVISTRTLKDIVTGIAAFGDVNLAVDMAANRYPRNIAENYSSYWLKIYDEDKFSYEINKNKNSTLKKGAPGEPDVHII